MINFQKLKNRLFRKNTPITIRSITSRDIPEVIQFLDSIQKDSNFSELSFKKSIRSKGFLFLLAINNETQEIIGTGQVNIDNLLNCQISNLAVHKDYRYLGIGKEFFGMLMLHAQIKTKKNGTMKIISKNDDINEKLLNYGFIKELNSNFYFSF